MTKLGTASKGLLPQSSSDLLTFGDAFVSDIQSFAGWKALASGTAQAATKAKEVAVVAANVVVEANKTLKYVAVAVVALAGVYFLMNFKKFAGLFTKKGQAI
jgi:hypothetical protein